MYCFNYFHIHWNYHPLLFEKHERKFWINYEIRSFEDYIENRGIKGIPQCKIGARFENFMDSIALRQLKKSSSELVVVVLGSNDIDQTRNAE